MTAKVAPRKTTSGYRGGHGCLICDLPDEKMQRVNADIWDGNHERVRGYRSRGMQTYFAVSGKSVDARTVARHADHIEETWRTPTTKAPAGRSEVPVLPHDYRSLVEQAGSLGAYAMARLNERIAKDVVEDRELVSIAKMGVVARAQQEANRIADKKPQTNIALIFGLAGGQLAGELPEYEMIDVTPEKELRDEIAAERQALVAAQASATGELDLDDLEAALG